jgi:predicted methyltransferase
VVSNAIYHDTVWLGADRAKMNAAIFRSLEPGGVYVVIDSSAKPGTGVSDVQTLHRIDEQTVKDEVLAAGFQLAGTSDVWRNAQDARDWNASPVAAAERRGTSDRFALKFVKPR